MAQGKRILALLLIAAVVSLSAASPVIACVGKTLVIGTTGTAQQNLLAEILTLLITERTGTTVKTAQFDSLAALHQAHLKADVDIAIGYTGQGQLEILKGEPIQDSAALYSAVKTRFNEELNLIWLEPLGFEEPTLVPAGVSGQAAPVVRKDTLKKFPALARLINKLGGAIDQATVARLQDEAAQDGARDVARAFLRENRLI